MQGSRFFIIPPKHDSIQGVQSLFGLPLSCSRFRSASAACCSRSWNLVKSCCNVGPLTLCLMVYKPRKTIVVAIINHSEIGVIFNNLASYRLGAPLCGNHSRSSSPTYCAYESLGLMCVPLVPEFEKKASATWTLGWYMVIHRHFHTKCLDTSK